MTNPLGSGVTRYIDARDKQLAAVVFQGLRPPLDSELNLMSLMDLEARAEQIRSTMASGWLLNESNPMGDYFTASNWSNHFYFGRNTAGELRDPEWAVVNGWLIPVTGTRTGSPPLAANNSDTHNKIELNPPPSFRIILTDIRNVRTPTRLMNNRLIINDSESNKFCIHAIRPIIGGKSV